MPARAIVLALAIAVLAMGAAAAPAALRLDPIGTFDSPVYVTSPPRDGSRLLVAERAGTVRLLIGDAPQATPFLDLRDRVLCCEGERGLGSIAFAPDYTTSGLLYAYYTARNPLGATTVSEFRRSAADPNVADPASERILAQVPHSTFSNHNGGQLQFGPDGLLYAGTGDGGGGGDPDGNAQNPGSPLGKLLRIDPRTAATEVYAAGVRNPWRFSFDRQIGDLVLADVGQNRYEEVDLLPAGTAPGANLGWNRYEGLHTYPGGAAVPGPYPSAFRFPVLERPHSAGACSITGGYVVRDPGLPDLAGRYVYGDFCDPAIRSAVLGPGGATDDRPTGLTVASAASFGEDACGRVYVASLVGTVSRLSQGPSTCEFAADGGQRPTAPAAATAAAQLLSLRLRLAARQHALRTRRVSLAASCDARCTITATGRFGPHRLSRARATAPTRAYRRLRLRIGPATRRALRRSPRPTVTLAITARDTATGRTRARTVRVRVLRQPVVPNTRSPASPRPGRM